MTTFSCRGARSPALFGGILAVVAIETAVLHVWLRTSHPIIAWTLTTLSVVTLAWMIGDFRAAANAAMSLDDNTLQMNIGWRFRMSTTRATIAGSERATWRQLPEAGKAAYLNATAPADPNVVLTFEPPAVVQLPFGLRRKVRTLGLCLDEPDAFLSDCRSAPL